jgi:hypothetical protein
MFPMLLPNVSFHLHRFIRAQPILCAAILLSLGLFVVATLVLIEVRHATSQTIARYTVLGKTSEKPQVQAVASVMPVGLLPFSSAQVVQVLNDVSEKTGVPINEISFSLDEGSAQPFLRYRASFNVSAKYLAVRRFIDSVHSELHDVSLDSVSCTRENVDASLLKCDLVFSAFYAKADHG